MHPIALLSSGLGLASGDTGVANNTLSDTVASPGFSTSRGTKTQKSLSHTIKIPRNAYAVFQKTDTF